MPPFCTFNPTTTEIAAWRLLFHYSSAITLLCRLQSPLLPFAQVASAPHHRYTPVCFRHRMVYIALQPRIADSSTPTHSYPDYTGQKYQDLESWSFHLNLNHHLHAIRQNSYHQAHPSPLMSVCGNGAGGCGLFP